jgi:hypothetical protein
MSIAFDKSRWERVRENYALWWAGKFKRPLFNILAGGHDPGRPEPALPSHGFTSFYDLSVPAEAIVDRWDYNLSTLEFLGDGFPSAWPNFGPGVLAGFLGADLINGSDTTWFHPPEIKPLESLRFAYDPRNRWLSRVRDICRAAMERWEGLVQVGMTDLGGTVDVLSTFRPNEHLLLDLVDRPADVKRLTWELHNLWWRAYDDINAALQPVNPGYSGWLNIYSAKPYYPLQCDFAYMIGPDMFDEFIKPELAASCRRLGNSIYHLDGVGQLPHLDSVLAIPELTAIQWVPGEGKPWLTQWPEVYRKIRAAGKRMQIWGSLDVLDTIASQIGTAEGLILIGWVKESERRDAEAFLARHGAM